MRHERSPGDRGCGLHRQSRLQGTRRVGTDAGLLRHPGEGPSLGGALGPARTGRHRRRRAPRRGLQPAQAAGNRASGGLHRGRRIGAGARALPAQQCGQDGTADRRGLAPRCRGLRLLEHLRRLRPAAVGAAVGSARHRADEPLRRVQGAGRDGARQGGVAGPARSLAALLQRRRRRCGWRDRRGAPAGNAPFAARGRRRPGLGTAAHPARHRLSDRGRLVRARLHPCQRPGRRACARAALAEEAAGLGAARGLQSG